MSCKIKDYNSLGLANSDGKATILCQITSSTGVTTSAKGGHFSKAINNLHACFEKSHRKRCHLPRRNGSCHCSSHPIKIIQLFGLEEFQLTINIPIEQKGYVTWINWSYDVTETLRGSDIFLMLEFLLAASLTNH